MGRLSPERSADRRTGPGRLGQSPPLPADVVETLRPRQRRPDGRDASTHSSSDTTKGVE